MPSLDVIATERGYYGHKIVEEGEAFTLEDSKMYSARWMEPAKDDAKSRKLIEEAVEYQQSKRQSSMSPVELENLRLKQELAELKEAG